MIDNAALNDLRGMMVIMRKAGYRGDLTFHVTRDYAREIWVELRESDIDMPMPEIGDTVRLEFHSIGRAVMEVA